MDAIGIFAVLVGFSMVISVSALTWDHFRSQATSQILPASVPRYPIPDAPPEDVRGTAVDYCVVTCQMCLAQHASTIRVETKGPQGWKYYVLHGGEGATAEREGWSKHYGRWLCPECGERMKALVVEA